LENVLGEVLKEFDNISSDSILINNNEFQSGIYFVKIEAGENNVVTKKIVINN
jgi:hypothetical protein